MEKDGTGMNGWVQGRRLVSEWMSLVVPGLSSPQATHLVSEFLFIT